MCYDVPCRAVPGMFDLRLENGMAICICCGEDDARWIIDGDEWCDECADELRAEQRAFDAANRDDEGCA